MVKRKEGRRKKIPYKKFFIPEEEISNSPSLHPNATLTSDASLESSTSGQLLSKDSTNAPEIGEESGEQIQYAESYSALIDKYLLSNYAKYLIPFAFIFFVISYIFIQDNGAGKLTNWQGIWWTIQKSGILLFIFLASFLFILSCRFLYEKLFKRKM